MKAQKTTKTAIAERHRTLRAVDTVIRSRIRAQIRAACLGPHIHMGSSEA